MGKSLNSSSESTIKRKIEFVDVTGLSVLDIKTAYNNNYGLKGWRIVQAIVLGSKTYIIAEREL